MRRAVVLLGLVGGLAWADEPIEPEEPPLPVEHPPSDGGVVGGVAGGVIASLGPSSEVLPCEGAVRSSGLRKEVFPTFPLGARDAGPGPWTCSVCVDIGRRGRPTSLTVSGCPAVFEAPSREAVLQSRWRPLRVDGRPAPFRTRLMLRYRAVD